MSLLFDAPLIPGLRHSNDIISQEQHHRLIDHLGQAELSPFRFHGWFGNRKTTSFGWRYDFEDASFTRAEPIPDWLQQAREQAAAFAALDPEEFVHVLLARYDPAAGIGWHRDRDVFGKVVGLSLGAPATLRLRRRTAGGFERAKLEILPCSAYLLSNEARWDWEHSIAPGDQLRFSITFRTLSPKGRRIALQKE